MDIELRAVHPDEPGGDTLALVVEGEPASLQAKRWKKRRLTEAVKAALQQPKYLLTGEVSVRIEWLVHERLRYETLVAPDVDNIIKAVLDAVCGPEGVLVNDCKVQNVASSWIDDNRRATDAYRDPLLTR